MGASRAEPLGLGQLYGRPYEKAREKVKFVTHCSSETSRALCCRGFVRGWPPAWGTVGAVGCTPGGVEAEGLVVMAFDLRRS
jgi:hypothetical protein